MHNYACDTITFTMDMPTSPQSTTSSTSNMTPLTIAAVVVVLLGVGTGLLVSQAKGGNGISVGKNAVMSETDGEVKVGQVYGSTDEKAFRDSAEGTLEKGGLEGEEGSHKLVRPGGEDQTAYLTSSTLDLDKFVGRKVKVWGETFSAKKAGWFMDIGRVQILE